MNKWLPFIVLGLLIGIRLASSLLAMLIGKYNNKKADELSSKRESFKKRVGVGRVSSSINNEPAISSLRNKKVLRVRKIVSSINNSNEAATVVEQMEYVEQLTSNEITEEDVSRKRLDELKQIQEGRRLTLEEKLDWLSCKKELNEISSIEAIVSEINLYQEDEAKEIVSDISLHQEDKTLEDDYCEEVCEWLNLSEDEIIVEEDETLIENSVVSPPIKTMSRNNIENSRFLLFNPYCYIKKGLIYRIREPCKFRIREPCKINKGENNQIMKKSSRPTVYT
ncbi:MAG: hypothetical protein ATN36_02735 [Epulopiscium sp. Nele67-Bin005]|nr:MAG: hypothetical protein ATN36_02735 [Epulopiscium sp. Nele67-Bin005]